MALKLYKTLIPHQSREIKSGLKFDSLHSLSKKLPVELWFFYTKYNIKNRINKFKSILNIKPLNMIKKLGQLIFILLIICFMIVILFSNWPKIKKSFSKPKIIVSKVTLNNECTIISDAFVVVHVKSKRLAYFSNNLARIKLHEGDLIRLAISPKYPNFEYNGESYKAKKEIIITANCEVDPRMKSIFNSMREQFN